MAQINRILVGVEALEGSSHDAFDKAKELAKENNATLIIAFVMDKNGYASLERMDPHGFRRLKKQAETRLKGYKEMAEESGLKDVETVLEVGIPKKEMENLCEKYNVDMIVVGETGTSKVDRIFLGNTAKAIQKKAKCDVKVISTKEAVRE
ncbi:universal stress protein [Marinococcus halophilus]|uniref:universal stress protein n=1 Tax=Marinococcus halophilus TaxID=1371 RepID=UPI0015C49F27|nr:universal stress protein [Marinococcus halophilus]